MNLVKLPYKYVPRPYQEEFFKAMDSGIKRAVLVHHRRAGKDLMCFNYMIRQAFLKPDVYWYCFPLFTQARKAIWEGRTEAGMQYLDYIPKSFIENIRNDQMYIKLRNGSIIRFVGSDVDNLVGASPRGIVLSEYSLISPNTWGKIEPMIMEKKGWAVFNGTPRGQNWFYDLYTMAKGNSRWYASLVSIKKSGVLTEQDIEAIREEGTKAEEEINQEYYCSFYGSISGAYYAKWIDAIEESDQIKDIGYNEILPVHTAWDLGVADSTSIWFYQITPSRHVHLIDYYEASGEGIQHYINLLKAKPYRYGYHHAPHDIKVRELGTGKSRLEIAQSLGLTFRVVPQIPFIDGVEYVRILLRRCFFDKTRCNYALKMLRHYRKKYDEVRRCFSDYAVHDYTSHAADSFRYLALSYHESYGALDRGPRKQENYINNNNTRKYTNENLNT